MFEWLNHIRPIGFLFIAIFVAQALFARSYVSEIHDNARRDIRNENSSDLVQRRAWRIFFEHIKKRNPRALAYIAILASWPFVMFELANIFRSGPP